MEDMIIRLWHGDRERQGERLPERKRRAGGKRGQ